MPFTTALSLTAHDAPVALIDQLLNITHVGGFDIVSVHINKNADFDLELLQNMINHSDGLRHKIHINPQRVSTDYCNPGFLHRAHHTNFRFLSSLGAFDTLAFDASNTLLLVPGLKHHMQGRAIGIGRTPAFGWNAGCDQQLREDLLHERHGEAGLYRNQIEGLYVRADIAAEIFDWQQAYDHDFDRKIAAGWAPPGFAREEYVFATALAQLNFPLTGIPYILMRNASIWTAKNDEGQWEPIFNLTQNMQWLHHEIMVTLQSGKMSPYYWEALMDHSIAPIENFAEYKSGKFGIKRVARDPDDPIRVMVGQHFGYRGELERIRRDFSC